MSGERVMRPFVLIIVFVVTAAFALGSLGKFFTSGAAIDATGDDMKTLIGVWDYSFYTPDNCPSPGWSARHLYNVTNDSVISSWPKGETGNMPFDSYDKWVYVVRDSEDYEQGSDKVWEKFTDYIGVKRKADDLTGGKVYRWAAPIQKFVDNFDKETNISRVDFTMSGKNYSVFLHLMDNNTDRIWWNNYTLHLGASILQTNMNIWAAIGMIMTAQIPNCNPIINLLVACVVDITIAFVVVNMIMRIIPFAGGG